jgi:hypothetical protein
MSASFFLLLSLDQTRRHHYQTNQAYNIKRFSNLCMSFADKHHEYYDEQSLTDWSR